MDHSAQLKDLIISSTRNEFLRQKATQQKQARNGFGENKNPGSVNPGCGKEMKFNENLRTVTEQHNQADHENS